MDEDRLVAGEPVVVGVRITNLSGQTLLLGKQADWVTFAVESKENFIIPKLAEADTVGEFTVASAKVATRRVDLAPAYLLTAPGRYTVTATVAIPQWDRLLTSDPKKFDIITGTRLWEQVFGVPNADGGTAPPDERKYALLQAMHQGHMRLHVRLSDKLESKVLRVLALGEMVSFGNPAHEMDKTSNLHVLWQTPIRAARSFGYIVISPQGDVIRREIYDYSTTRPGLKFDQDGNVAVVGGLRRITPTDIPAASAPDSGSQAKPLTP
jgi:hypothetical protein